ncbi:putative serine carboxypeptidase S28 [Rosellinia necatrix]|uniref:Putative serine carboxypeptidase S28 n=1 Tax=Rosellinia necatrix TaxID=77044 RepID=A0A1S7UI49_ROSNE|nr:putative serine carboxypeptidase S28 [Rosellinia necatrix]
MRSVLAAGVLSLIAQLSPAAAQFDMLNTMKMKKQQFGMKHKDLSKDHRVTLDDDDLIVMGKGTFDQLLDHNDPEKGTFQQRYWWNAEFYEEDGPIFLFSPGESDAENAVGYLENYTLPGYYAQQFKGAAIVLEHRYWGKSIPFDTLTAETLQYLNVPNSISDLTYFASNVDCQFCEGGTCNSDENPWVLIGGSYSGALAAWTSQLDPGTFTAYHASSAVVEAIYDFWEYFNPIEAALPRNCSADVKSVIQYIDSVLASGDEADVTTLKTRFGLSALRDADFADIISNPLIAWQSDQDSVISFCDHIESASSNYTRYMSQSDKGVGLVAALNAYSSYVRENINCGKNGAACDTYDGAIAWNTPNDLEDDYRPWMWMLCNEPFGWYQTGPPTSDGTSIIPSVLRPEHYQRRCPLAFPETNGFNAGSVLGFQAEHLNQWTKGWDAPFRRVLFVNGEHDPWKSATVAADSRPGGPIESSDEIPSLIVEKGVHVPDLVLDGSEYQNAVIEQAVAIMGGWLNDWKKPDPSKRAMARRRL